MVTKETLFDLFGEFSALFPARVIQSSPGIVGPGSSPPDMSAWLGALNNGVELHNILTGATANHVSITAELNIDNVKSGHAEGFPFVLASMPDIEFRIQSYTGTDQRIRLFASISDCGCELVIEQLPVEIRLKHGLVQGPTAAELPVPVTAFVPGQQDDLQIVYRQNDPTSIYVHIRLIIDHDGNCIVRSAVPVSFGPCFFLGLPCKAVHDFTLIPSPDIALKSVDWLRHSIGPWIPNSNGPVTGLFAVRTIKLDPSIAPIAEWNKRFSDSTEKEPTAEFVLEDLVLPFHQQFILPIPRHITVGIRRNIIDITSEKKIFDFDHAPVKAYFRKDPEIALIVESFFYKSQPSEDLKTDLGLTFEAGIAWAGHDASGKGLPKNEQAILIGLEEHYTPTLAYRRAFSKETGMPAPESGFAKAIATLLHWEIATIALDIMGLRAGYSLGKALGEGKGFRDCFLATFDVFISMPPTGGADSNFQLRGLNGELVKFGVEGLGWRLGSFHVEGLAFPDGVAIIFAKKVKIILEEISLVAENGATYLSISGGLAFPIPKGFEVAAGVKRLRFRVAGATDVPSFKLDGFFIRIKGPQVLIEAGGFFTDTQIGTTHVKEFGLTGTVGFDLSAVNYVFGLDLLVGSIESPTDNFDYLMFQIFFRGSITIAWFELRGARVLFAHNMQPKLQPVDKDSQQLRYYNWYKKTNPIDVPGDRRLAAWQSHNHSWALGIGVSASIASLSKVCELSVFVLVVVGDDEHGFLICGELRSGQNPTPLGFFALEWDGKNNRFSLMIGVNLTIKAFLKSAPDWVEGIAKLTGTIYISNDPGTFAIGRLADERTWLSLLIDIDIWLKVYIQFGFCVEYVDGPTGAKGCGLIVRLEGGMDYGIIGVQFHAGFGFLVATFTSGSTDYAVAIWIEAGIRLIVFHFLHFGLSARAEFRNVGGHPSRGELKAEFKLEMPWFLPDVTWTFSIQFGDLLPADLATAVNPLRIAAACEGLSQHSSAIHIERFDQTWDGVSTATTHSVNEFRAGGPSESDRLRRFEDHYTTGPTPLLQPIATDSTISVDFAVPVNDQIGLGVDAVKDIGKQASGDLQMIYELIGVAIRRRSRFGNDHAWHELEEHVGFTPDFSDPNGVLLLGTFKPEEVTLLWDKDVRVAGKPGTKKLLINAKTPFEFATKNTIDDEQDAGNNPNWPCCRRTEKYTYKLHEVIFTSEVPGADLDFPPRLFTESTSRLTFYPNAWVRPQQLSSTWPPTELVSAVQTSSPGLLFRAEFDEDVAFCFVWLAWPVMTGELELRAYDQNGIVVGDKILTLAPASDFQNFVIPGQGPIRRLEARLKAPADTDSVEAKHLFEIFRVAYIGLDDYLHSLIDDMVCGNKSPDWHKAWEGKGKLFFLPNYDYEIAATTRIRVAHPSKPEEKVEIAEYVYFKTKGLPGLNAVKRVGEEIEPYVNTAYTGGRGVLYREEPITLAFKEDFSIALPILQRPAGTSEEHSLLLQMQLLVRPETAAATGSVTTATAPDWVVSHRTLMLVDAPAAWENRVSLSGLRVSNTTSTDPFRVRLAELTQRKSVIDSNCGTKDPRDVLSPVLIAPPQGEADPANPGKQLWPTDARLHAIVTPQGSGFVDRPSFVPTDATAFQYSTDAGKDSSGSWSVANDQLLSSGSGWRYALFGETSWNYLILQVAIVPGSKAAGIGVSLPSGNVPYEGMFAVVESSAGKYSLKIYRLDMPLDPPAILREVAHADLPAPADIKQPINLIVGAYDDKLRASVGDIVVEADRTTHREGRLALVAQDGAQFASLQVSGLQMYAFPAHTSRYRSFEDHIHSFSGKLDVIGSQALGPGTTTTTTAALWGSDQSAIADAMKVDADPKARGALFDKWAHNLGIPLKDDVAGFEISRYVPGGGSTDLLFFESPEELDFVEEITVELKRRDVVLWPLPPILPPMLLPIQPILPVRSVGRQPAQLLGKTVRDRLFQSEGVATPGRPSSLVPLKMPAASSRPSLLNLTRYPEGIAVTLTPEILMPEIANQRTVIFAEIIEVGDQTKVRLYQGKLQTKAGEAATVKATATEDVILARGAQSAVLPSELSNLSKGTVAMLSRDLRNIVGSILPVYIWTPVVVQMLQDVSSKRAFMIPISGGLAAGFYNLTLKLSRKRWQTNDAPDDTNQYERSVTISFEW